MHYSQKKQGAWRVGVLRSKAWLGLIVIGGLIMVGRFSIYAQTNRVMVRPDRTPPVITGKTAKPVKPALPRIVKEVLPNGLTVLIKPGVVNQVVAVNLYVKTGPLYETITQRGISSLTQKVLIRGSVSRTAREIALETESAGARISSGISSEVGYVSLSTTLEGLDKGLEIFLDLLQNPTFTELEIAKEKKMLIDSLKSREDQPFDAVYLGFTGLFYHGHPLGVNTADLINSVQKLNGDDLVGWYKKTYVPGNMVLSIVGNVNSNTLLPKIRKSLGKLSRGETPKLAAPSGEAAEEDQETHLQKSTTALFLMLGYPAPESGSRDSLAMDLIDRILGGGSDGRLYLELREKRGLAYTVGTGYDQMNGKSYIYAIMATAPANYTKAREGIIREFKRLTTQPVAAQTLKMAKQALCGAYLMSHETNAAQGQLLGRYELLGFGYGYDERYPKLIGQVSAADIQRVARKYFRNYTLSVVSAKKLE